MLLIQIWDNHQRLSFQHSLHRDIHMSDLFTLLTTWNNVYGDASVLIKQVIETQHTGLKKILYKIARNKRGQLDTRRLAYYLKGAEHQTQGGLVFKKVGTDKKGQALWQVVSVEAEPSVSSTDIQSPTQLVEEKLPIVIDTSVGQPFLLEESNESIIVNKVELLEVELSEYSTPSKEDSPICAKDSESISHVDVPTCEPIPIEKCSEFECVENIEPGKEVSYAENNVSTDNVNTTVVAISTHTIDTTLNESAITEESPSSETESIADTILNAEVLSEEVPNVCTESKDENRGEGDLNNESAISTCEMSASHEISTSDVTSCPQPILESNSISEEPFNTVPSLSSLPCSQCTLSRLDGTCTRPDIPIPTVWCEAYIPNRSAASKRRCWDCSHWHSKTCTMTERRSIDDIHAQITKRPCPVFSSVYERK